MRQWYLMEYEPKNQNHLLVRWPYICVIHLNFKFSFFVKCNIIIYNCLKELLGIPKEMTT